MDMVVKKRINMSFDRKEAKAYLKQKEQRANEELEQARQTILENVISILKKEFSNTEVEVYLVGSITRQFQFSKKSDVDIVLRHFKGDRFEIWPRLENLIGRKIELILYENCSFQDHIEKEGLKVI